MSKTPADADVIGLFPSWGLHLRAERKSPATVKVYSDGVTAYITFCQQQQLPVLFARATVDAFVAELLDKGAAASTARSRQLAVRRFSAWAAEEGEQSEDPLVGLKSPSLDTTVVNPLTHAQLVAFTAACRGNDFRSRRDEALIRFMAETGVRAGEAVALRVEDVDLGTDTATTCETRVSIP